MPDSSIKNLPAELVNADEDDLLAIVDLATNETKKIKVSNLVKTPVTSLLQVYEFQRRITSSELLTGFSNPIQLLATPGAGKVIVPFAESIIVKYNPGGTHYTSASGGQGSIYTNTAALNSEEIVQTPANILDGSNTEFTWCASGMLLFFTPYAFRANQPIMFQILTSNPTGGDGTLDIYFHYKILTVL